ncbi:MAG: AraC family transcriptional regulator [Verrucomicrobiales bacterium]|nr:AraC family transcriptional regulator [Verrucomicrobiales bacterium]
MNARLAEGQYYGCCHASRRAGFLVLSESAYAPGIRVPTHTHENPYFIFTLNGGQVESLGTRERTYLPSTLAFHPAGEAHSERVGAEGMRCLHVEFRREWLGRHAAISRFLSDGTHFQGGRLAWLARRIHREFRDMDDVGPVVIEGLVLEILADASRFRRQDSPAHRPRWLIEARDLIRSRFAEPLSLSDVAAAVGVSPVRLARAFRTQYQCSVGELIRQIRIESACQAMLSHDQPLAEIALAVGFADQAHFARTFKRITGQTPGQFRATSRGR